MARQEHDREDLLREATALVRRIELVLPHVGDHWVVGFRPNGAASVFVGADLVFQFNAGGELRRGFANGHLLKAERGGLVQLERRRLMTEVQLVRHPLSESETRTLLELAKSQLDHLQQSLRYHTAVIVGQVPADAKVAEEVLAWIESLPMPLRIAAMPNVEV